MFYSSTIVSKLLILVVQLNLFNVLETNFICGWVDSVWNCNSGSIPGQFKPVTTKIGIHKFLAWCSRIKRDSVKPPLSVVDRWVDGSLTLRPIGPFAVLWPSNLANLIVITIIILENWRDIGKLSWRTQGGCCDAYFRLSSKTTWLAAHFCNEQSSWYFECAWNARLWSCYLLHYVQ